MIPYPPLWNASWDRIKGPHMDHACRTRRRKRWMIQRFHKGVPGTMRLNGANKYLRKSGIQPASGVNLQIERCQDQTRIISWPPSPGGMVSANVQILQQRRAFPQTSISSTQCRKAQPHSQGTGNETIARGMSTVGGVAASSGAEKKRMLCKRFNV